MYEARRILEVGAAGLAAERATPEQIATLAEEVASLFASMEDPQVFLVHDINFHRGVAAASGNPIVASLVEMVSALYYERRRETAVARQRARPARRRRDAPPDLPGDPARDADTARRAMHDAPDPGQPASGAGGAADGALRAGAAALPPPAARARAAPAPSH